VPRAGDDERNKPEDVWTNERLEAAVGVLVGMINQRFRYIEERFDHIERGIARVERLIANIVGPAVQEPRPFSWHTARAFFAASLARFDRLDIMHAAAIPIGAKLRTAGCGEAIE
jgi:hypothetical protein